MQAIERELISHNWITLLFVSSLLILFFLKLFSAERMKGYSLSIFQKGFIEIVSQEKQSFLSVFDVAFTAFSFLSISLAFYFSLGYFEPHNEMAFAEYTKMSSFVLAYMLVRNFIEAIVMRVLDIQNQLVYFFLSKKAYLYSISIGLFFLNILYFYGYQDFNLLFAGIFVLFGIRFTLIVINNKNLIIKELFYFILYLCSFEIAPLLILFKLIR